MKSRAVHSICLAIICIQIGIIAGIVVRYSEEQARLAVMREELTDWEQIAEMWKRNAVSYALASEGCRKIVRTYQRSIFQPVEMAK